MVVNWYSFQFWKHSWNDFEGIRLSSVCDLKQVLSFVCRLAFEEEDNSLGAISGELGCCGIITVSSFVKNCCISKVVRASASSKLNETPRCYDFVEGVKIPNELFDCGQKKVRRTLTFEQTWLAFTSLSFKILPLRRLSVRFDVKTRYKGFFTNSKSVSICSVMVTWWCCQKFSSFLSNFAATFHGQNVSKDCFTWPLSLFLQPLP